MTFQPEHIVTDNPHGICFYGPVAPEDKDDNTCKLEALDGGYTQICNKNGNASVIVPGKSEEVCGINLAQGEQQEAPKEALAKIITARNGDIAIIAESGNIKFKAKNIYVECIGDGEDGSFLLKANDHITMTAGEQITISGSKLCMLSSDSITLNAQGFLNFFCADVVKSSPLNVIAKILTGDVLGGFIDTVRKTCG